MKKTPGISGKFSGEISSGNFWHFGNFPRNFHEVFLEFHCVYINEKIDFRSVVLDLNQKNILNFPGIFPRNFSRIFGISKISLKVIYSFPWFSYILQSYKNIFSLCKIGFALKTTRNFPGIFWNFRKIFRRNFPCNIPPKLFYISVHILEVRYTGIITFPTGACMYPFIT